MNDNKKRLFEILSKIDPSFINEDVKLPNNDKIRDAVYNVSKQLNLA